MPCCQVTSSDAGSLNLCDAVVVAVFAGTVAAVANDDDDNGNRTVLITLRVTVV